MGEVKDVLLILPCVLKQGDRSLLNYALSEAGISPGSMTEEYICYNLAYTVKSARANRDILEKRLRDREAKVIVPFGEAFQALCGLSPIMKWRGMMVSPDECRRPHLGKVEVDLVLPPFAQVILPTISPATVRKNPGVGLRYWHYDMARLRRAIDGKLAA